MIIVIIINNQRLLVRICNLHPSYFARQEWESSPISVGARLSRSNNVCQEQNVLKHWGTGDYVRP